MRARWSSLFLVVFALAVARPPEARAWNPIAAAKRWISGKARSGAASLAEAASVPVARNLEATGKRLLDDAEDAIARRMDQAERVTTRIIGETDRVVASTVDHVDRSVEARIVQVSVSANELLDRAFGRLDRSIGRIDGVARRRIDQLGAVGGDLIKQADKAATELLRKADAVLARRLEDVRSIVHTSIEEADRVAAARIEQLDEIAARRLGTVDVIATKQSLALEATVLRVASLVGLVGFVAFVLWRLFVELSNAWAGAPDKQVRSRVIRTARHGGRRFLIQLGLAGAGAGVLWFLSDKLPSGARERANRQIVEHQVALVDAVDAFDFQAVRYELAQLEVLRPADLGTSRVLARKSALLERVFVRSASLQSVQGMQWIMREALALQDVLGEDDPDLLVLEAYVLWQTAETRQDEYDAAALCARALTVPARAGSMFHLAALAHNYVTAFLHAPYVSGNGAVPPDEVEALRATLAGTPKPPEDPRFQHVIELDELLAALDTASTAAYLEMLDAHAAYVEASAGWKKGQPEPGMMKQTRAHRAEAAERVVGAWSRFDDRLASSPWLVDDPISLAVFTLNDAVLSHALYFLATPDAATLPGAFLDDRARLDGPVVRVKAAPIRVAWARRYAELLGPNAQDVLAFEETQRFAAFEADTRAFEAAYVAFVLGTRPGKPAPADLADQAARAIEGAAKLTLYRDGHLLATTLLDAWRATGAEPPAALALRISEAKEQRPVKFR